MHDFFVVRIEAIVHSAQRDHIQCWSCEVTRHIYVVICPVACPLQDELCSYVLHLAERVLDRQRPKMRSQYTLRDAPISLFRAECSTQAVLNAV
jgi:hypothetical protein